MKPTKTPVDGVPPLDPPVVIGLLGGVAAGKSFVAGIFEERGFRRVDADEAARTVVADPAILAELTARFGPTIVREGTLDRPAMAALVFADPAARRDLEAITHPAIRTRILAALDAARADGVSVVLDAPLLLEGGLIEWCDAAVFLEVDEAVREARARTRGWEPGERARREAAQAPLEEKRRRSRFIVPNDGPAATTRDAVAAILAELAGDL